MSVRRATAYHEAGHCVIGRILGLRGGGAYLAADRGGGCAIIYSRDAAPDALLMIRMAGPLAETLFSADDDIAPGDRVDRARVQAIVDAHGLSARDVLALQLATCDLLLRHERAVRKVAVWLKVRGKLDGALIDELVEGTRWQVREV
jgi:hypothetical protein